MAKKDRTEFGLGLEEALGEVLAHRCGEIDLPTRRVAPMTAAEVKVIRKAVARSPKDFERRFHVSARTVEGWEQGKKVDTTAATLLRVIAKAPEAVERALADA